MKTDPATQNMSKDLKTARRLLVITLLYTLAEGTLSLWFGEQAGSVLLTGFGIDSLIELTASGIVLWHFINMQAGEDEKRQEKREQFARQCVGWTFIALSVYVAVNAVGSLWFCQPPEKSIPGMLLAILSIVIMPILARKKLAAAQKINSEALELEAKESLCCFWLSVILLAGLALNSLFGLWWADPVGGLMMLPWIWREGIEAIRNKKCCGCS